MQKIVKIKPIVLFVVFFHDCILKRIIFLLLIKSITLKRKVQSKTFVYQKTINHMPGQNKNSKKMILFLRRFLFASVFFFLPFFLFSFPFFFPSFLFCRFLSSFSVFLSFFAFSSLSLSSLSFAFSFLFPNYCRFFILCFRLLSLLFLLSSFSFFLSFLAFSSLFPLFSLFCFSLPFFFFCLRFTPFDL